MTKIFILDILKSNNFNTFIEYIFIFPLLYLIQYNYNKFKYIALFLSVFILIKNIIILNILGLLKKKYIRKNKLPFLLIYKLIKMFIGIIFFFLQYKYKLLVNYNIWIANLFYLKYLIKFISNKYSINSVIKLQNKFVSNINNLTK
jgi:hypothetical protein